jgi:hypothetical protein
MALTLLQTPASVNLSQSPMAFSISSSTDLANAGFQYVCELYIWSGSPSVSGSYKYQLVKYPNDASAGIFEVSRIVNSTMTDLLETTPSNVKFVKGKFYYQYLSGSTYVTSSVKAESPICKALDGYAIFQEPIGQAVYDKTPHWPLMTDGPATQSCFTTNTGFQGVYIGNSGATLQPNKIVYTSNLGVSTNYSLSTTTGTSGTQVQQYPVGPSETGFPISTIGLEYFYVQPYSNATPLGTPIKFEIGCTQKYPNVRIKWKNRFGQWDLLNFNMISRNSFQTEKRTYEPQLGSWNAKTLSYQQYDTAVQNYIVDSKLAISVNSWWLPESFNEILKQLLVSDEIYWVYNEANDDVRPLTVTTSNVVFKTGVVDHLIQYQIDFNYGQGYKLII